MLMSMCILSEGDKNVDMRKLSPKFGGKKVGTGMVSPLDFLKLANPTFWTPGIYTIRLVVGVQGVYKWGVYKSPVTLSGAQKGFLAQQLVGERVSSYNAVVGGRRVDTGIAVELVE